MSDTVICRRHQWVRTKRGVICSKCERPYPREQIATHNYNQPQASPHRAGHHTGLHPEDQPYQSSTIGRTYVTTRDYDVEDLDNAHFDTRSKTSARTYMQPGTYTHGNTRFNVHYGAPPAAFHERETEELSNTAHQGKRRLHWSLFLGAGMILMLVLWLIGSYALQLWQIKQDDWRYGRPRTFQIDAVVGHSDSLSNPSHFIAINLNRHVEIIEFPGGDATKARIFLGPTLVGDGQDLTPITLSFKSVTGSGKPDMLIHIQDQTIVFVNTGSSFRPATPNDHINL